MNPRGGVGFSDANRLTAARSNGHPAGRPGSNSSHARTRRVTTSAASSAVSGDRGCVATRSRKDLMLSSLVMVAQAVSTHPRTTTRFGTVWSQPIACAVRSRKPSRLWTCSTSSWSKHSAIGTPASRSTSAAPRTTSAAQGEAGPSRSAASRSAGSWSASPRSHVFASSAAGDSPRTIARTTPLGTVASRRHSESASTWYGARSATGANTCRTPSGSSARGGAAAAARSPAGSWSKYAANDGASTRDRCVRKGASPWPDSNSASTTRHAAFSTGRPGSGGAGTNTNCTRSPSRCRTRPNRCVLP